MLNRARVVTVACGIMLLCLTAARSTQAQDEPGQGNTSNPVTLHIVQAGESLESIARLFQVSPTTITTVNRVTPAELTIGRRLIVPTQAPVISTDTMIVGIGDPFTAIAMREGISVQALAVANKITNPVQIVAGEQIVIPQLGRDETTLSVLRLAVGESLWDLALRSNMNPYSLSSLNGLSNPSITSVGQFVVTPKEDEGGSLLATPWNAISMHPLPLEIGRSGVLTVETINPGTITLSFLGHEWQTITDDTGTHGMLGIDRWTAAGLYPLIITFQGQDGSIATWTRNVRVRSGGYGQEIIRLSDEDAAVLGDPQAVQEEVSYITSLMSNFTVERRWDGLFWLPAAGVMSSGFGTARSYDLGVSYNVFHGGADFAAPTNTPTYAPANGVVVDTATLTVRGNATIIDHGWGVYSGFWHQSSILVQPGDVVTAGQQIGTIGSTGLSTAAHLHWELWVGGSQVDPLQWVRETFP